jgi:hypothetical protein
MRATAGLRCVRLQTVQGFDARLGHGYLGFQEGLRDEWSMGKVVQLHLRRVRMSRLQHYTAPAASALTASAERDAEDGHTYIHKSTDCAHRVCKHRVYQHRVYTRASLGTCPCAHMLIVTRTHTLASASVLASQTHACTRMHTRARIFID